MHVTLGLQVTFDYKNTAIGCPGNALKFYHRRFQTYCKVFLEPVTKVVTCIP